MFELNLHADEHKYWWDDFVDEHRLRLWIDVETWLKDHFPDGSVELIDGNSFSKGNPKFVFKTKEDYVHFMITWRLK